MDSIDDMSLDVARRLLEASHRAVTTSGRFAKTTVGRVGKVAGKGVKGAARFVGKGLASAGRAAGNGVWAASEALTSYDAAERRERKKAADPVRRASTLKAAERLARPGFSALEAAAVIGCKTQETRAEALTAYTEAIRSGFSHADLMAGMEAYREFCKAKKAGFEPKPLDKWLAADYKASCRAANVGPEALPENERETAFAVNDEQLAYVEDKAREAGIEPVTSITTPATLGRQETFWRLNPDAEVYAIELPEAEDPKASEARKQILRDFGMRAHEAGRAPFTLEDQPRSKEQAQWESRETVVRVDSLEAADRLDAELAERGIPATRLSLPGSEGAAFSVTNLGLVQAHDKIEELCDFMERRAKGEELPLAQERTEAKKVNLKAKIATARKAGAAPAAEIPERGHIEKNPVADQARAKEAARKINYNLAPARKRSRAAERGL